MTLLPSQAFGQAVREIRRERELSQEQAALEGGIDRAYYGHIERATKSATLKTVWRMAAALNVRPSAIFVRAEQILEAQAGEAADRHRE
jgi:transcriptional regulator with XRE-family HTH domain